MCGWCCTTSGVVCLVALLQVDGVACGFVSLSCDVDLDVLSTCFDLEPFQGLCRPPSDDRTKSEPVQGDGNTWWWCVGGLTVQYICTVYWKGLPLHLCPLPSPAVGRPPSQVAANVL